MLTTNAYKSSIEKGYPLTHYPKTIPKVQDKIVARYTLGIFDDSPLIRVAVGRAQHAHGDSLVFIQDYLNGLCDEGNIVIPNNTLTVSFAMRNFSVGNSCQEFYPNCKDPKTAPEEAFFTYRMLSKHCQATYYNTGGTEFLAGMCYYLQLRSSLLITTTIDGCVMRCALDSQIPYPLADRWETRLFKTSRCYGRECNGRRVQVWLEEGKEAVHRVFNYRTFKYEYQECEECREEAKTYQFEPAPIEEKMENLEVDDLADSDDSDGEFADLNNGTFQ